MTTKTTSIRFFCVAYLSDIDSECSGDHIDTVEITEACFTSLLTDCMAPMQYERHTVRENGCAQVCLTLDLDECPNAEQLELVKSMTKWTDEMVREYFDTHWSVTIHEVCALSGRTKADVIHVLTDKLKG